MTLFGGIEAGGTKFICAIGSGPSELQDEIRFETASPRETIRTVISYFEEQHSKHSLAAIGIGSFGPLDLNPESLTSGYILNTPKRSWQKVDLPGQIRKSLNIPVAFDTDVNAAALGEYEWGAARGLTDFIYLTVGTGIGGGGMINGNLMHGLLHPEMGHILIPHDREKDPYPGHCPYHGDCFEGLAGGPALRDRWGTAAENLGADHPAWDLEAEYLSLALVNYICSISPRKIIIGGGIMKQPELLPRVRSKVKEKLNGYLESDEIMKKIEEFIVPPGLGDHAGIVGAICLAKRALE
ncbi:MAG: ROK family protein [Calditrichota bacterium]